MLERRPEYKRWGAKGPFYELYRIGDYTFANWKVVFREQATSVIAAVVGPYSREHLSEKAVIADHKLMLLQLASRDEAHYVCALLNSSPSRFFAEAYFIETAISTHLLDYIKVPKFNPKDAIHMKLADASQRAHKLKAVGKKKEWTDTEQHIDEAAAELWGITPKELEQIQKALNED